MPAGWTQLEEFEVSDRGKDTELPYHWIGTTYYKEICEDEEDEIELPQNWEPAVVKGLMRGVGTPSLPRTSGART